VSVHDTEIDPTKPLLRQLMRLEPEFCPNCSREVDKPKRLEPEHKLKVCWQTFCGYCGAIYRIEVEP
jgi:hypothetical protein